MTDGFRPKLSILPVPQRRLWDELHAVPSEFVLYGGTALALHLGHRQSVDFDFFGNRPLDEALMAPAMPFLAGAIVTQRAPNTFGCTIDRGGVIQLSFFGLPDLPQSSRLPMGSRTSQFCNFTSSASLQAALPRAGIFFERMGSNIRRFEG